MLSAEKLLDIGIALSSEKNTEKLLDTILEAAIDISNCDAGTLFILQDNALYFRNTIIKSLGYHGDAENDARPRTLSRGNVCAVAALDKTTVNIADVHEEKNFNFTGPKELDSKTGVKIVSVLAVPMEDDYGDVIGVLQLVNAMDENGKIIPFAPELERVLLSLASQAAISLTVRKYSEEVSELLDSFVRVMSAAIDARSPYNANHTRNMAKYAGKFVAWLKDSGIVQFNETRERQFMMSVWLHDIGKLVVPLEIMDKESRLASKITAVEHRFQVIGMQNEIDFLKGSIDKNERDRRGDELSAARELVEYADRAGFLPDEKLAAIRDLGKAKAKGPEGKTPYLSDDELECLLVRKGTLTDDERLRMESHVTMTRLMLDEMSFPKYYRSIPSWASMHHEYLNGSGYPDKLTGESIPPEVRVLSILDIYDALTARDRPYKPAIPTEKAFAILDDMAAAGQIDAELLELFKRSEAWRK